MTTRAVRSACERNRGLTGKELKFQGFLEPMHHRLDDLISFNVCCRACVSVCVWERVSVQKRDGGELTPSDPDGEMDDRRRFLLEPLRRLDALWWCLRSALPFSRLRCTSSTERDDRLRSCKGDGGVRSADRLLLCCRRRAVGAASTDLDLELLTLVRRLWWATRFGD